MNDIINQPFFDKKRFLLCRVPVPKGYPQSQTHSGVAVVDSKILLTTSPYPHVTPRNKIERYGKGLLRKLTCGKIFPQIRGEYFENPLLYEKVGETSFRLAQTTPLMSSPDPIYGLQSYNSDPDIFVEGRDIHILNRQVYRLKDGMDKYQVRIYMIEGALINGFFSLNTIKQVKIGNELMISPCLSKISSTYVFTSMETLAYNDGISFDGIYISKSEDKNQVFTIKGDKVSISAREDLLPWHMSIFEHNGTLYSIIACVYKGISHYCNQFLGEFSDDLDSIIIYPRPITDYNSYRSSAYVSEDGVFHLYLSVLDRSVKGDNSVDGRNILYANTSFDSLLNILKHE